MKTQFLIFFTAVVMFLGLSTTEIFAQNQTIKFSALPSEKVLVSSIAWRGHFGGRKEEPANVYVLMTQGAFRAPTSDNFETLTESWLTEHPQAQAVVVYEMSGFMSDNPDSKLKSVWVIDGDNNLNVNLVRQGGCPSGTMMLNPGDKTSLKQEEYEDYVKKLIGAEKSAKKEKLGIWSNSNE